MARCTIQPTDWDPTRGVWAMRLNYQQITSIAGRSGLLACGSLLSCLLVLSSFWSGDRHGYLLGLLIGLLVMHGLAVAGSVAWLRRPARPVGRRAVHVRAAMTAIIASAWASVPIMLMPHSTADQRELLVYVFSGLVCSSILLAPIVPAALSFAAITSLGLGIPVALLHHAIGGEHLALIVLYFLMISGVVVQQGRDFARRVLNELTMAEQGEIIGLLLNDFEENASDWLWEVDPDLRLHRPSDRLLEILGCPSERLQGVPVSDLLPREFAGGSDERHDVTEMLACLTNRTSFRDLKVRITMDGRSFWFSVTGRPILDEDGTFRGYRGVGSDITSAYTSNARISYLAHHDSLTDLPNRARFHDTLDAGCRGGERFALLCLDLDGFKSVNDTLGHSSGDALLVAVAGRLRSCLREGDVVARLGGDEFAVLQAGGDETTARALAMRLIRQVAEPFQLGKASAVVELSVGIALFDGGTITPEELLQGADLALYRSKTEGRGRWHFFEATMAAQAQERHALQSDLRHAIGRGELMLDFQPILDMASGTVTGAEALVRWLHPVRGRISPADFIPLAEETGLIVALGAWVLRRACQEAVGWPHDTRIAVNLSPLQFRDPGLLDLIDQVLTETGLPPQRLELEITESVFLEAADRTVACLQSLRARGIFIALDDFGTGYSSLSYLRSFPFDKVKIDQSFIRDLSETEEATAIVRAIVGMATSLGMRTTGEGVETAAQASMLERTGCTQAQGYLFGRPCSPDTITAIMRARGKDATRDATGDACEVAFARESHAAAMHA